MTLTIIPTLIGSGISLFKREDLEFDIELKLIESKSYPFGFVQSKYQISYEKY